MGDRWRGGSDMKFFKIILTWNHGFNSGHKEIHAVLTVHSANNPNPNHSVITSERKVYQPEFFCTMP